VLLPALIAFALLREHGSGGGIEFEFVRNAAAINFAGMFLALLALGAWIEARRER
jgi:hypothetical protein